ncbi:DUF5698 domain-containing protein [Oscillospiraceae bacterium WX1]
MELFLLCIQVFFCRIVDVSLGTVRTILTVKGKIASASAIGFVEIFVWFVIVQAAISKGGSSLFVALSYAGGFAAGTWAGGRLANTFLRGFLDIQIVTSTKNDRLVEAIQSAGFGVSVLNVNSSAFGEEKYLLVIEIRGSDLKKLQRIVYHVDPTAFVMARETTFIHNGFFK